MSSSSSEEPSHDDSKDGDESSSDHFTAPLAQVDEGLLNQTFADPLSQVNEELLNQTFADPLAQVDEELLNQTFADPLTQVDEGLLNETFANPLTQVDEDLLNDHLAYRPATLPNVSDPGSISPNRIRRASTTSTVQRKDTSSSLWVPSFRTVGLLNWAKLRARIWAASKVLGPVIGFLSLVQSCKLAQQSRELQRQAHRQRQREHQEIIVNQRENSQQLDDIESQIETTDDDRYITIVGKRSEVRASPDSQAVIANRIRRDTQVEPITIDNGWVRIRYIVNGDESYGWVDATYLKTIDTQD